ncbi:HAMP domain-containing protein [Archangium violaceum]|nr:HAMP domain-containing protein [Archangium violaceum]
MGVWIAGVIALATLVSYFHLVNSVRDEALAQLARYVEARVPREQALFVLAEDNHALLKASLEERIRAWGQEDPTAHFDSLYARMPDGAIRCRLEHFDGTKMPGGMVSAGFEPDADLLRRFLASYDVLAQHGPAMHVRFANTFISLPEGAVSVYWPEYPDWCRKVGSKLSVVQSKSKGTPSSKSNELWLSSQRDKNPERQTVWSSIYREKVSKNWMVSVSTPLDMEGRLVATIGHDVLLTELMARTVNDHLPDAYNIIFRDDGLLIAHPELMKDGSSNAPDVLTATGQPDPSISQEQRAHLRSTFEHVKGRQPGQVIVEDPEYGEYIAVTRLKGPGWYFATVLPQHAVTRPALRAARYVLFVGVLSLALELAIMYWVLNVQLSRPLLAFTRAADQVTAGDFTVSLDVSRKDELGRLAHAFQVMTEEVQRREEALRQANEGLEQRVEERTRELQALHQQLVGVARQAGMAEIATNVLHNVGNVLNSVFTSATLAREQLSGMKLEHVGRVGGLLEENQASLATFLSQDERGCVVAPFLVQLGQHLTESRQEILSLLDDLGRYTAHIGTIVKVQQNYASAPKLHEQVQLAELIEDALRINVAALGRSDIQVERHFAPLPPVTTDKHKVLMILVNLISNARYAVDSVPSGHRRMVLRIDAPAEGRLRISVRDNGVGIPQEMLTCIFQHGFTTREGGHGFGLHASALAAQELGGSLVAESEGPGLGATFILELPYPP